MDFFCKYDQICRKLRKWSHLLKKSLMENAFVFSIFSKELRTWGNVLLTQYWKRVLKVKTASRLFLFQLISVDSKPLERHSKTCHNILILFSRVFYRYRCGLRMFYF